MCRCTFEIFPCCPPQTQRMRGIEVAAIYNCKTKSWTLGSGPTCPNISSTERFVHDPLRRCKNCTGEMSLPSYNPTTSRSHTLNLLPRHLATQQDQVQHRPSAPHLQGTVQLKSPVTTGDNCARLDSEELHIPEMRLPPISNSPFEAAGSAPVQQQQRQQLNETGGQENRYYSNDDTAQKESYSYDGHSYHSPSDDEDECESLSPPEFEFRAENSAPFVHHLKLPGQHPNKPQQEHSS